MHVYVSIYLINLFFVCLVLYIYLFSSINSRIISPAIFSKQHFIFSLQIFLFIYFSLCQQTIANDYKFHLKQLYLICIVAFSRYFETLYIPFYFWHITKSTHTKKRNETNWLGPQNKRNKSKLHDKHNKKTK